MTLLWIIVGLGLLATIFLVCLLLSIGERDTRRTTGRLLDFSGAQQKTTTTMSEPILTDSLLDERRRMKLCARCGNTLTKREAALEGVGGSYVRCNRCVRELMRERNESIPH